MLFNKQKTVAVGLSGGVDSSVAAALLKKQGYAVTGVHIKIWSDPEIPCTLRDDRYDAMRVGSKLNIPFQTWDFTKAYRKAVVDYMIHEYRSYRTPNPDVMCNKKIKFGLFLKTAKQKGFDFIATGHHARLWREFSIFNFQFSNKSKISNFKFQAVKLLTGKDKNKDQSYFLWTLNQDQLKYILFPIGEYTKKYVRRLAKKFGLPTAQKKDSQGICFIGEIDIKNFLKKYIPEKPGKVITTKGEIVGKHDGLYYYTIGQRHGIGIGGGIPYYVAKKDVKTNTLVVAQGADDPALFAKELTATDIHWIADKSPDFPLHCKARIRYRQPLESCQARLPDGQVQPAKKDQEQVHVIFTKPQRAVAPGQSIVFYSGDEVLGGGIIE